MKRKTFFRVQLLILSFVIMFSILGSSKAIASSDLTRNLKDSLIPIKTTKAESGYEDLEPLKEVLKDKTIIAMGESTHGTKEFFEMKHRMFEFLVKEMGYRVFAIEAEFGGAQIVNDYILHGKGTIKEAIWALDFWTWSTEEVAKMLEWMKIYNENPMNKSKVKFYGFDIQGIENDLVYFLQYLNEFDEDISLNLKDLVSDFQEKVKRFVTNGNKQLIVDLSSEIVPIKNMFEENREMFIMESSKGEYDINLQHLNVISQFIELNESLINEEFTKSFNVRDYHMAQNVNWILDYEAENFGNGKVMLWAHNGHIAKKYGKYIPMGEILSQMFHDKYYALGFCFYKGGFRSLIADSEGKPISRDIANFLMKPSTKETFAHEFEKTKINLGYLDFKLASLDNNIHEFLSKEQSMYNIGAVYGGKRREAPYLLNSVPMRDFDGMIFIRETTPAIGFNRYITKIEDGNKFIGDNDKSTIIGVISISLVAVSGVIYFIIVLKKKAKNRKKAKE